MPSCRSDPSRADPETHVATCSRSVKPPARGCGRGPVLPSVSRCPSIRACGCSDSDRRHSIAEIARAALVTRQSMKPSYGGCRGASSSAGTASENVDRKSLADQGDPAGSAAPNSGPGLMPSNKHSPRSRRPRCAADRQPPSRPPGPSEKPADRQDRPTLTRQTDSYPSVTPTTTTLQP